MKELFFKFSNSAGALLIKLEVCLTIGGTTKNAKMSTKIKTIPKIADTAAPRLNPRRRKNSTAGFKPIAKKIEIKSKTKIWLAAASERSNTNAVSAPQVARNPK